MEKRRGKFAARVYGQKLTVHFEYPVYFTHSLFHAENPLLESVINRLKERRRHRVLAYVDSGVAAANPGIVPAISAYFAVRPDSLRLVSPPMLVPGGENAKNGWEYLKKVLRAIGDKHICRQSFILAVGGGSVLDMVGFAASLVHRGIRLIRVPSTVLAQNDAGVGVKNGMNERCVKNFIGSFQPPFAVINDFDLLRTLKPRDWIGGIAEAFKVAIIKDREFFAFLKRNAARLRNRDMAAMEALVQRCAVLHLDHIRKAGDPFEMGSARPLDFGHWAAHKLETMSSSRIGHGQAVAIGIAMDSCYAMRKGLITKAELIKILHALVAAGLPVWNALLDRKKAGGRPEVLDGIEQFREHLGGTLAITLPKSIGRKCEVNRMDAGTISNVIVFLGKYHRKLRKV